MVNTIDIRDLRVKKTKTGYLLMGLESEHPIKPREALALCESLLRQLPEITDGVRVSWELRSKPYLKVRTYYQDVNGKDEYRGFQGEVWIGNVVMFRGKIEDSEDQAIAAMRRMYGDDTIEHRETYDAPGSKELAHEKIMVAKAMEYIETHGLTMAQFVQGLEDGTIKL